MMRDYKNRISFGLSSKIFLPYKHCARNSEEGKQNTEKIKNIKYKVEDLIKDSVKYLYQERLNEKLKELIKMKNIYGNILEYSMEL